MKLSNVFPFLLQPSLTSKCIIATMVHSTKCWRFAIIALKLHHVRFSAVLRPKPIQKTHRPHDEGTVRSENGSRNHDYTISGKHNILKFRHQEKDLHALSKFTDNNVSVVNEFGCKWGGQCVWEFFSRFFWFPLLVFSCTPVAPKVCKSCTL